jgi:hypothetical protein
MKLPAGHSIRLACFGKPHEKCQQSHGHKLGTSACCNGVAWLFAKKRTIMTPR